MNVVFDLLNEIQKNEFEINTFNIFIKDKNYKIKFLALIDKLKQVDEFKKMELIFPDIDHSLIKYIKTYSTHEKCFKNIVLFNPNLYEKCEREQESNKNISYKILSKNENTNNLMDFISYNKNFISDFIAKQNRKVFVSIPMLKAVMFNKESINIDLKTNQKEFDSKVYKQGKKNYLLKKERFIEFNINKEQLLTTVRFILPNVFIICLDDHSYLYQNKIILSDKLQIRNIVFPNIMEKFKYIINLYQKIYNVILSDDNVSINISIKRPNVEKIKNNPFLFQLKNNVIITDKFINFKYVTTLEDYKIRENVVKDCLEKQNKFEKYLKRLDQNSLLFYDDNKINLIFTEAFQC
ncbi:putative viral intermediate transcription factor 45 kDa subunit [Yalta virus]|nr:putative viral intermediate transcription factor 45 kDa subunit [Yalta virus]